jgi:hypothetical protein
VNTDRSPPYHYGDVVQLTAVPTVGWSLQGWSGDLSGSANPTAIAIDGNKAVTATFTQIPVGGEWVPINTAQMLVQIIGSAIAISAIAASFAGFKRMKRKQN